jgi:peptidoglycan/LPS O-acetylase OafA/YrhL
MAVDIFIVLSGFVMVYTSRARGDAGPASSSKAYWDFMRRRFWRLSPAFFVVFAVALGLAEWTGHLRESLTALGSPAPQGERYTDHSPSNVLLHLSYLFGLFPSFSSRSPIPDWSISLEMQFYVVFPLIFAVIERHRWKGVTVVLALGVLLLLALPGYFDAFSKPSALPMKINLFLAGMVLASLTRSPPAGEAGRQSALVIGAAVLLALVPSDGSILAPRNIVRPGLVLALALLILCEVGRARTWPLPLLRSRGIQYIGDISYSLYLVHLVILVPVEAILARITGLSGLLLAGLSLTVAMPFVLAVSSVLYHFVEKPGIAAGKWIGRRRERRRDMRYPSLPPAERIFENP